MISVSQLQFVAQLRSPPRSLRRVKLSATRAVIGGPGLWASMDLFHNLQSNCYFPVAVKAFDTLCTSIILKTGLTMEASWRQGVKVLEEAAMEDDACLSHPLKQWLQGCAVYKLKEICTSRHRHNLDKIVDLKATMDKEKNANIQAVIYKHLLPIMHPFDLVKELGKKFQRWFSEQDSLMLASRASHLLKTIHSLVPPCVLFCLISTWCNAWCTNKRFQGTGRCRLSTQCEGEDSLDHYAVCSCQWQAFSSKLKRSYRPDSIIHFFGLEAESTEDMVFHACHTYAVKRGVDIRHRGINSPRDVDNDVAGLIWNGHRTAALYHQGLAKRYLHIHHPELRGSCI